MDYELETLIAENADADEIGEYMMDNRRKDFNGKYFLVGGKRLYPIVDSGDIIGWEFD